MAFSVNLQAVRYYVLKYSNVICRPNSSPQFGDFFAFLNKFWQFSCDKVLKIQRVNGVACRDLTRRSWAAGSSKPWHFRTATITHIDYNFYRPSRTTKCAMSMFLLSCFWKQNKKEINWIRATDLEFCSFFPTSRMGSVQSQARNLKMTQSLAPIWAGRRRTTSPWRSGSSTIASRSTCWTADFRSLLAFNPPSPFSNWI